MSLHYLDASAWVKCYVEEIGSDWMRRFWSSHPSLICSSIGMVEVVSAIVRRSSPPGPKVEVVLAKIKRDRDAIYEASVSSSVIEQAEEFVRRYRLRSADAIHLASAAVAGKELEEPICLVASDTELLTAAAAEGLEVIDPQTNPPLPVTAT